MEVKRLLFELHTNLVRVCASPAPKYFQSGRCINLSECMWCGCRRADPVVSQAYPGMPRYVMAFLHLRQPSSLFQVKGLWVVWSNSGEVMTRLRVLENVDNIKYLGVTITNDLKWNTHISNICTKSNRTLGFLRRTLFSCPQNVKEAAYKGISLSRIKRLNFILLSTRQNQTSSWGMSLG